LSAESQYVCSQRKGGWRIWVYKGEIQYRAGTVTVQLVLATVPVLDPAGFIGLCGNGLTPLKINDFLCAPSHYGYKY
jgi:hypothetical protein